MYENGNMPKKKSPIKAILLTILILLLLFAGGVVLWGTNGYRIKLADTYSGKSVTWLRTNKEDQDGKLFNLADDVTVTLNPLGKGTMIYDGKEYAFSYKYIGYTTEKNIYPQRRFSMKFKEDTALTFQYTSFSGEKYEVTLDHINDMCFRFFPPDNSKDITLEIPLDSENLFSIHLPKKK